MRNLGSVQHAVPILPIHDEAAAREFYVDFLGFWVERELRACETMRVTRLDCTLDLSRHRGDVLPH